MLKIKTGRKRSVDQLRPAPDEFQGKLCPHEEHYALIVIRVDSVKQFGIGKDLCLVSGERGNASIELCTPVSLA